MEGFSKHFGYEEISNEKASSIISYGILKHANLGGSPMFTSKEARDPFIVVNYFYKVFYKTGIFNSRAENDSNIKKTICFLEFIHTKEKEIGYFEKDEDIPFSEPTLLFLQGMDQLAEVHKTATNKVQPEIIYLRTKMEEKLKEIAKNFKNIADRIILIQENRTYNYGFLLKDYLDNKIYNTTCRNRDELENLFSKTLDHLDFQIYTANLDETIRFMKGYLIKDFFHSKQLILLFHFYAISKKIHQDTGAPSFLAILTC